ncbi:hypothetical protein WN943_027170 [Citrus x changshan-huyou]
MKRSKRNPLSLFAFRCQFQRQFVAAVFSASCGFNLFFVFLSSLISTSRANLGAKRRGGGCVREPVTSDVPLCWRSRFQRNRFAAF